MRGQHPWDAPERLETEPTDPSFGLAAQTAADRAMDEAKTTWAQPEPVTHYRQVEAEPVTQDRQQPAYRSYEAPTHYAPRPHAGQSAQPAHYESPEPATSYWRNDRAAHVAPAAAAAPHVASPRAETFLSSVHGGQGRPAVAVAMASPMSAMSAMAPMTLDAPARAAGASSRRSKQPARAPSHLTTGEAWTSAERTRLRHDGEQPQQPAQASRKSASSSARNEVRNEARDRRAVAGELSARSGHSQASYSHAAHVPAVRPSNDEQPSRSIAIAAAPAPRAASLAPAARDEELSRSIAAPVAASMAAPAAPAAPSPPAGPLRIDAPPEVVHAAYPLVRRVALQQDLKSADRVLRVGLSELTNSTTCRTWFLGADQQRFSLELDSDVAEAEQALLDQSFAASQPRAAGRLLVVPVIAAGRVIALALLARGDNLAAFAPAELMISMVVMQETSGLLVQLLVHHAQGQRDAAADAKSIYNAEALASQRKRGHEGGLVHLSPRWVRIAYPAAVIAVVLGLAFAVIARVPTYSAGAGVITIEGVEITSPSPGSVAVVRVQPGQPVRAHEELVRLLAQDEESALVQADREYRNALATLLFDGADETTKAAVAAAASARQRATDRLEARVIRAPSDGIVGDIRVRGGAALAQGDHVLTLLRKDAEPTVLVFLPGQDRPRLRKGQTVQIELAGYTKVRERATITEVGTEVIGPNEARRALGQKNADAVALPGPVVMVRAKLPTRTFKVSHDIYRYHDGMPLRGEVKVENKPFLVSLIPALEKAL